MDYSFLQTYWWFLVSLLGALLVLMLFVFMKCLLVITKKKLIGTLVV